MTDTLLSRPRLATAIAAYIGLWSGAEFVFAGILDRALGGPSKAYDVIGPIWTISERMKVIRKHLAGLKREAWAIEALGIMEELEECNRYRNKLAHGWYMEDKERNGVLLVGNPLDSRRPFLQEPITHESVIGEYRTLEQALLRLMPLSVIPGEERRITVPAKKVAGE